MLSLENSEMLPRANSAARKILRFEENLESTVMRMAKLGCIYEENEPKMIQTEGLERGGLSKSDLLCLAHKPERRKNWRSRDMVVEAIFERKLMLI